MRQFSSIFNVKNLVVSAVLVAVLCVAPKANAASSTLADLINNNDSLIVNGFKFDEFSYIRTGDMPEPELVNVIGIQDSNGHWGLRFQGAFVDLPGNGLSDGLITYRVMALDEAIVDAHLQANTVVLGGPGFLSVTETFLPDDPVANMSVFNQEPGPQQLVDWWFFDKPHTTLHVQKDIFALASGQFGAATISFIDQTFSVPEPGTAIALIGFGTAILARRRRR